MYTQTHTHTHQKHWKEKGNTGKGMEGGYNYVLICVFQKTTVLIWTSRRILKNVCVGTNKPTIGPNPSRPVHF